jgi:hypothetical protein
VFSIDTHLTTCWAIVQLAGRRVLIPLIKVQVLVAQPFFFKTATGQVARWSSNDT